MKPLLFIILSIVMLSGCAAQSTTKQVRPMTPRENAAFQLTKQGIQHLDTGNPDNAIRAFEQAIGLNPGDGPCYYYLAEAWLAKGALPEARQFNRLASDYLRDDAEWADRMAKQRKQIEHRSNLN